MKLSRDKILKELSDKKIEYWDHAELTPSLYEKKRIALSNYQQHLRDKNNIEKRIIELRKLKDK